MTVSIFDRMKRLVSGRVEDSVEAMENAPVDVENFIIMGELETMPKSDHIAQRLEALRARKAG